MQLTHRSREVAVIPQEEALTMVRENPRSNSGHKSGLALLAAALLAASCMGDAGLTPTQRLDAGDKILRFGSLAFTAIGDSAAIPVIGGSVAVTSITWRTTDPDVATVDQGGVVHAVSAGTAYVVGQLGRSVDSARVTVAPVPTQIVISPNVDTLSSLGASANLSARLYDRGGKPAKGAAPVWRALNPSIVTVDSTGRVTAVQPGTGLVTAASGMLLDTATVVVVQQVASVTVSPSNVTLLVGRSIDLTAVALDSHGSVISSAAVTWISAAPTIATVANGTVTGVAVGSTRVTATAGGKSAAASVSVSSAPIAALQVSPSSVSAVVGSATQLVAQAVDASGNALSGAAVTWSSSNTNVATVSASGLVSALATGSVTITASSGTSSGTAAVSVAAAASPTNPTAPVAKLTLLPSSAMLDVGAALQFAATPTDSAGNVLTGRTITWSSASTSVATISSTGLVSGAAAGQTTITASCEGKVATAQVTVQAPVASVVLVSPAVDTLKPGSNQQLTAVVKDAKGNVLTGRSLTWRSLAPAIASVSVTGVVTALAAGTGSVVATADSATGSAVITVVASPSTGSGAPFVQPALPQKFVDSRYVAPSGQVISLAAGGDLQAALNNARPGDVVELAAGATYTGNFTLPAKGGSSYIIVRSSGWTGLPAEGTRVSPANASVMARVVSPNAMPALNASNGSSYWRVMGIEVVGQPSSTGYIYSIISMQPSSPSSLADYPHHIVLDRVYVHPASDGTSVQRCVSMNAAYAAVVDSYLAGCHYAGADAQAIGVWDSPGPLKIEDNYLEGSGENFMVGGAATSIAGLVTEDVTFRRNYVVKPLTWIGSQWTIKNLFETKNVRRILVEGNVFENNWSQAQNGVAIVLKSNGENCPQAILEDLTFRYNIVRNSPKGLLVSGRQENYYPHSYVEPTNSRILVTNNVFDNVGSTTVPSGGGEFWIFQVFNGPQDLTIDHNTVASGNTTTLIMFADPTQYLARGFSFTNNIAALGAYGVYGDGSIAVPPPVVGANALGAYAPGYVFAGNVLGLDGESASYYPAGNYLPSSRDVLGLTGFALPAGSVYLGKATDGSDPGADVPQLNSLAAGVKQ